MFHHLLALDKYINLKLTIFLLSLIFSSLASFPCDSSLRNVQVVNQRAKPYEWTDEVPADDSELQRLLKEDDNTALYSDISAEPPGVELELEESDFQLITDDPEPNFCEFAAAALAHRKDTGGTGLYRRRHRQDRWTKTSRSRRGRDHL